MNPDFTASATTAGALVSTNTFEIPQFQREYASGTRAVRGVLERPSGASLSEPSYFLGLVILTGQGTDRKQVVDGQQRLLSITLLATVLYREAQRNNRTALARRIRGKLLKTVNYETEEVTPRFVLADSVDDSTLRQIIEGAPPSEVAQPEDDGEGNLRANAGCVRLPVTQTAERFVARSVQATRIVGGVSIRAPAVRGVRTP